MVVEHVLSRGNCPFDGAMSETRRVMHGLLWSLEAVHAVLCSWTITVCSFLSVRVMYCFVWKSSHASALDLCETDEQQRSNTLYLNEGGESLSASLIALSRCKSQNVLQRICIVEQCQGCL